MAFPGLFNTLSDHPKLPLSYRWMNFYFWLKIEEKRLKMARDEPTNAKENAVFATQAALVVCMTCALSWGI